jgi:hypothetical protein
LDPSPAPSTLVLLPRLDGTRFAMYANPQPAAQAIAAFMAEANCNKTG